MKTIKITCDVIGCGEEANYKASSCLGWKVQSNDVFYKKMEKPSKPEKVDLCHKHWIQWAKATIKVMKMQNEIN